MVQGFFLLFFSLMITWKPAIPWFIAIGWLVNAEQSELSVIFYRGVGILMSIAGFFYMLDAFIN
ncbi:hypothetical protein KP77_28840 [Jeotgalibacillus alimentarius]|uniref:DUF6199 domain-containing protein n=1 Tax=Jeotgalibacillus alimentarius TaxID=135826 RepID=A0A0C2VKZ7_9BACL|nr:hypothetical protein [Jeotgalibacillus alimentarius]KIL44663.1 hypothetical protein KP77_28840 [Jeotgalibacillus alimentarius]